MSDNGMILHITAAGRAQKAACRLAGLSLPKFSGWVIDQAVTQTIDAPVIDPLYASSKAGETLVYAIDAEAIGIRIVVPPDFSGWVRGIALLTEDGTIYAYQRFAPENNGVYKPGGTAIRQLLILAEDGRESVEFTYSVLDIAALRSQLITEIRDELNIPALAAMLQEAQQTCLIDGNDTTAWTLDGGEPDPQCQIIPVISTIPPIDGGIE